MVDSLILVIALSIDSFLAALAYGTKRIRIPITSAVLVSVIGTVFLGLSLFAATLLQQFIPQQFCLIVSFIMFLLMGLSCIFQGIIKKILKEHDNKQVKLHYSGISFVLNIYLDETCADSDQNYHLSLREAFYLAIALSIDSLVSGFAFGISIVNPLPVLLCNLCIGIFVILFGAWMGKKIAYRQKRDLSWISGILFLMLAFSRIM